MGAWKEMLDMLYNPVMVYAAIFDRMASEDLLQIVEFALDLAHGIGESASVDQVRDYGKDYDDKN